MVLSFIFHSTFLMVCHIKPINNRYASHMSYISHQYYFFKKKLIGKKKLEVIKPTPNYQEFQSLPMAHLRVAKTTLK